MCRYGVSFLVSVQLSLLSYWLMIPSASAHGTSRILSWSVSQNLLPVSASHNKGETFPLTHGQQRKVINSMSRTTSSLAHRWGRTSVSFLGLRFPTPCTHTDRHQ